MKKPLRTSLFIDRFTDKLDLKTIEYTLELLKPFWRPAKSYCFYPSSGTDLQRVLNLNAEVFFFSDYLFRRNFRGKSNSILRQLDGARIIESNEKFLIFEKNEKRGFFFHLGNREALELIHQSAGFIDFFVSVRDGCSEGGNNECTNNPPFIELLAQLAPKTGMSLFIDHSRFFDDYPQYNFKNRYISFDQIVKETFNTSPLGPTRLYKISVQEPTVHEWVSGNLRLTIEHDNILLHQDELDLLIGGNDINNMIENNQIGTVKNFLRFPPYQFRPSEAKNWTADKTLNNVIFYLRNGQYKSVGITAFGEGNHSNFLELLNTIQPLHPVHLRFFHLHADDFSVLKEQIEQEKPQVN